MKNLDGKLNGKVALITGAGSGMGYETTKLFISEGAKVIAVDYSEEGLKKWSNVENVIPVQGNVANLDDVNRMVEIAETQLGRLDFICNIAGVNDLNTPLEDATDEMWDRVMNIDLKAPFRICRRAMNLIVTTDGGSIVNIGSYAALRGNHGPIYTAAKSGLEGLTKSIAVEFGRNGVRCNIIHPGGMNTNIGETSGGSYHPAGQALSKIVSSFPVNWYGNPIEIAKTCLFLCSDDSKHINGSVISVDGGMACC
jgi:NAD(P)-dependent dehydrogenase (short-subunit alcohol dehydrogenase family)